MSRPLSKLLPEIVILTAIFAAVILVYHYKVMVPEIHSAKRIYVLNEDRLANAKIIEMQKRHDLGLITSDEGIEQEFVAFNRSLLVTLQEKTRGNPVFRLGSMILTDNVVDLTEEVAKTHGLDLTLSLEGYLEEVHQKLLQQRETQGE